VTTAYGKIKQDVYKHSCQTFAEIDEKYRPNEHLTKYLTSELSPLTMGNTATLLVNGEEKFPALIEALEEAREHIHIEYYIYENDRIGQAIADILIRKAKSDWLSDSFMMISAAGVSVIFRRN
jgi:cardiolipin synthase